MPSLYVVKQAFDDVVAFLADTGSTLHHDFGSEHLSKTRRTNSYIWVPVGFDRDGVGAARGGTQEKALIQTIEKFDVLCDGDTHEIAFLMAQNLVHALYQVVGGMADIRVLKGEWETPRDGEPQLGVGRLYVLSLGLVTVWTDRYVPIQPKVLNVPQDAPSAPNVPTTQPTGVVIQTYSSPDPETDGQLVATDTVDDD